ncbi:MAG: MATE family efflux transporter [Lachnospiraceae bacterium]|nr:MATE family efflux transporter [Lachnospiraceae bacterium]
MDKSFLRQVASLTFQMAIQNLINTGVMAADVFMIGRVGEKVLSASSLAGQVYFVLNLIMFGTCSGANVLIAQYYGKGDRKTIEKVMGISFRITLCAAMLFFAVTFLAPSALMRLFTEDPEVIQYGTQYLRIILFTYPIEAFVMSYLYIVRSMERVIISTVVYLVQLVVNVTGNAVLIYGLLGFPALGIRGAAFATLAARLTGLTITVIYAVWMNPDVKIRVKYILRTDSWLNKDFLRYALPVIFNEMFWGLAITLTAAIVGHLGSNAVAAQSVASTARQFAMVISFGIAGSAAIMIGKEIGKGDRTRAEQYGRYFLILTVFSGLLGSSLVFFLRPFLIRGMGFTGITADYANAFLTIMSYYTFCSSVNTTCVVGIFRAGGDTRIGLIMDVSTMYGGSILLGFVTAFILKWPVKVVFAFLTCDEVIKIPISLLRYRKKRWLSNITR